MDRFLASQSASRSLAMAMPLLCDFLGPGAGRTTNNTGAIQPGALPNFNAFLESGTGSAAQKPGTKEVSIAGMAAPTEKTTAPNQDSDDELEIVAASLASEGPPQYVDMKFTLMFDQPVEVGGLSATELSCLMTPFFVPPLMNCSSISHYYRRYGSTALKVSRSARSPETRPAFFSFWNRTR